MVDDSLRPTLAPDGRPQHPRGDTLACPRTVWTLAVLAMTLDIGLTGFGLSIGLAERNRVAQLFIQEFGILGAGVLLKGCTLTLAYVGWRLLPAFGPDAGRHRNLVPFAAALPSWAAVGINAAAILAVS